LSVPGPVEVPVVFDVNVLVLAVAAGESPFRRAGRRRLRPRGTRVPIAGV
jgi:hypothetical protein